MPGNTTPKVFRYPTLDMSPDVPRDLGYLATDIDNYLTNNPGPTGPQGPAGPTGAQGTQGVQGPKGDTGLTGLQGNTGAASTVPGPQGNPGVKGDTGLQGPKGDTGEQGIQGIQGLQGLQGIQGVKGDTGTALTILGNYATPAAFTSANLVGAAGDAWLILSTGVLMVWDTVTSSWFDAGALQGPAGPAGTTGPQGTQGIQGLKGDKGDQGEQGPVGPQGNTGLQGLQGIQGIQGLQGLQGLKGDQGIEGSKATFSITSATPPATPVNGQAWFNSDNGRSYTYYDSYWVETGSSLSGPQGPKGDTGDQGIQGPQGVAINLKASSLTVAALPSTGNVVSDARIVQSDGDLYIWDGTSWTSAGQIVGPQGPQGIQGPKGDTGDQGIQGIQGLKGDTGDQGIQGIQGIQGLTGLTGNTGAQGAQGIQGVKGDTGDVGPAGTSQYLSKLGNNNISLTPSVPNTSMTLVTTGTQNLALMSSLSRVSTGSNNIAMGVLAGFAIETGSNNIAIGNTSMSGIAEDVPYDKSGSYNIGIGPGTLDLVHGSFNTAIGRAAGNSLTTGDNNIILGSLSNPSSATVSNEITLGNATIDRFRIPGLGIDWTSSTKPGSPSGYTKIGTVTSNSGTTVSFTGLSGYNKYLLVWSGVYSGSAFTIPIIRLNNDSSNHEFIYSVAYNSSSIPALTNWSFKGTNAGSVGNVLGTPNASGYVYIDGANTTSGISFYGSSGGKWSDANSSGMGTFAGVYTGSAKVTSIVGATNDGAAYSSGTWVLWGAQ
jgi:hypothetical protein